MSDENEAAVPEGGESVREEIREAGIAAVKQGGTMLLLSGVLQVLLGAFCITAAVFTSWMITFLLGLLIIAGGVLQVMSGIDMPRKTKGRGWTITGGILAVVVGLFFVINPFSGMAILTYMIAIFLLVEGGLRIAGALELKPADGWGWLLFGGIVSIVLGFLLLAQWPESGLWFIGMVFGIHLLFAGVARITLGLAARSAARHAAKGD